MDEDNCSDKGSLNKCSKSLGEESLDQDHGEGPPLGKERSSKQREGEAIGHPRGCEKVRSVDSGHPQPSKPVCIHLQVMIWGLMVSSCTHRRWGPFQPGCTPSQEWCGPAPSHWYHYPYIFCSGRNLEPSRQGRFTPA